MLVNGDFFLSKPKIRATKRKMASTFQLVMVYLGSFRPWVAMGVERIHYVVNP